MASDGTNHRPGPLSKTRWCFFKVRRHGILLHVACWWNSHHDMTLTYFNGIIKNTYMIQLFNIKKDTCSIVILIWPSCQIHGSENDPFTSKQSSFIEGPVFHFHDHWRKVFLNVFCHVVDTITLPKTNIAPENRPSQKETSFPTIHFQVQAVSFREGRWHLTESCQDRPSMCIASFPKIGVNCDNCALVQCIYSKCGNWTS